jgi:aryl-alcohol dehydrogenase-like predicted oxidoreductase
VDICIEAGATMFDSGDVYSDGVAETTLGQAIKGAAAGCSSRPKAPSEPARGRTTSGRRATTWWAAVEASLTRLGTDYIDLYQMHGFDAGTPVEETLRALDDLVRAGKIRYIGCSNFSGWHLMKSLAASDRHGWARYVAHQAYYSLVGREYEWELMPLALDQGVGAVIWSPLGWGG